MPLLVFIGQPLAGFIGIAIFIAWVINTHTHTLTMNLIIILIIIT